MEVMSLCRVMLPLLVGASAFAQNAPELFEKAPPHVDEALRQRIGVFYQSHVDGKFRVADSVVHEDSKDAFFVAQKDRYHGFHIIRIDYSNDFSEARAVVAVDTDFTILGYGKRRVKIPVTTLWKVDAGEWWWNLPPPEEGRETPFGLMKGGPEDEKAEVYDQIANMPSMNSILSKVKVSKTEVLLSSFEPSTDEVIVTNGMPGGIQLQFTAPTFAGFEYKLDKTELGPGEKATISFRCDPPNKAAKPSLQGRLAVMPTNHAVLLRITFAIPKEVEDKIRQSIRDDQQPKH